MTLLEQNRPWVLEVKSEVSLRGGVLNIHPFPTV
jgi:hypothetical protein